MYKGQLFNLAAGSMVLMTYCNPTYSYCKMILNDVCIKKNDASSKEVLMELTDLKVVMVIIEEGSISRAAQRLDYVQSNVTARVRKLETELGIQLFNRHPKGVTPTEKGLAFSKYALDIIRMSEEAVMAVREPDYP